MAESNNAWVLDFSAWLSRGIVVWSGEAKLLTKEADTYAPKISLPHLKLGPDSNPPEAHWRAEAFSTGLFGWGCIQKCDGSFCWRNWCNQLMCDSSKNTFRLERNCRMRRHWHWFGNLRAHHSKKELLQREEVYGSWMAGLLFYIEANHLRMICDRIMHFGLRQWMSSDAISWLIAPSLCFCQPGYRCCLG